MKRKYQDRLAPSQEIDDNERAASEHQLNFNTDDDVPPRAGDEMDDAASEEYAEKAGEAGLTEAALPGHGPTADDAAPETLIDEDGARSPKDKGKSRPNDQTFSIAGKNRIGAGGGLDEAELARVDPLDGKPWDGEVDQ